jgi:AcrR family transcriptional regulator
VRPTITDLRRQPSQARSRRTVERILDAATELFERDGYTATTMSAIAKAAGVGAASLYQWFPTQDDVLLGLAERHLAAAAPELEAVASELREQMPPLEATVRRFVEVAVALNADNARFHRELFEYCPRTPPISDLLATMHGAMVDELVWHLRRVDRAGGAVRLRAELVVHAVDAVVHEVVVVRPPGPDRESAIDETVEMVVCYLEGTDRRQHRLAPRSDSTSSFDPR